MGLPAWNSNSNSSGSDSDSEPVKSTGVQRVTNRMEPKVKCGLFVLLLRIIVILILTDCFIGAKTTCKTGVLVPSRLF